jgi:hypothetical protein
MRKKFDLDKVTPGMKELLRDTASEDLNIFQRYEAKERLVAGLMGMLRDGVFWGDIASDIFSPTTMTPGVSIEYPLSPIAPGTEKDWVAFTCNKVGDIPRRYPEGDYLQVPIFQVANSIDWEDRYAREARWDIVAGLLQVLEAGFVKKFNDDVFHLLLSAGLDRNVMAFDSDANQGQFTKRLISNMKVVMRRNGGGNSTSINRFKLSDTYVSPEGIEEIRNWNLDQLDEISRNKVFNAEDGTFNRIFGVNLHDIDELGQGQEYQNFYLNDLAGALSPVQTGHAAADVELVIGLDLLTADVFKNPETMKISMRPDLSLERQAKSGYFSRREYGLGLLDNRVILLGSY